MAGRIEKPHKYQAAILNSSITIPVRGSSAYNKLREIFDALDTASVKNWIPAATAEVKMAQFEIDGVLWEIDPGGVVSNPAYGMYIAPKDGDLVAIGLKKVGGTEIITLCAARTGGNPIWPAVTPDGDIHVLRATTAVLKNPPSTLKWVPKALQITKPIIKGSATTQYRNRYVGTETKRIHTIGDGYTRHKGGWAEALFPPPPAGEEYVSVNQGSVRVTNGACYSPSIPPGQVLVRGTPGVVNSPLRPTQSFAFIMHRDSGSSCRQPSFKLSVEVTVRKTMYTAWYGTRAQADAAHAGTLETKTVTTGKQVVAIRKDGTTGRNGILIFTGDASKVQHITTKDQIHNIFVSKGDNFPMNDSWHTLAHSYTFFIDGVWSTFPAGTAFYYNNSIGARDYRMRLGGTELFNRSGNVAYEIYYVAN